MARKRRSVETKTEQNNRLAESVTFFRGDEFFVVPHENDKGYDLVSPFSLRYTNEQNQYHRLGYAAFHFRLADLETEEGRAQIATKLEDALESEHLKKTRAKIEGFGTSQQKFFQNFMESLEKDMNAELEKLTQAKIANSVGNKVAKRKSALKQNTKNALESFRTDFMQLCEKEGGNTSIRQKIEEALEPFKKDGHTFDDVVFNDDDIERIKETYWHPSQKALVRSVQALGEPVFLSLTSPNEPILVGTKTIKSHHDFFASSESIMSWDTQNGELLSTGGKDKYREAVGQLRNMASQAFFVYLNRAPKEAKRFVIPHYQRLSKEEQTELDRWYNELAALRIDVEPFDTKETLEKHYKDTSSPAAFFAELVALRVLAPGTYANRIEGKFPFIEEKFDAFLQFVSQQSQMPIEQIFAKEFVLLKDDLEQVPEHKPEAPEKPSIDTMRPHPKSGMLYLKGDEIAVMPFLREKGESGAKPEIKLAEVASCMVLDRKRLGGSMLRLRDAVAFFDKNHIHDIDYMSRKLDQAAHKNSIKAYNRRVFDRVSAWERQLKEQAERPDAWHSQGYFDGNADKIPAAIAELKDGERKKAGKLKDILKSTKREMRKSAGTGEEAASILADENAPGIVPSDDAYASMVARLEAEDALLPASFKTLLAHHQVPVIIRETESGATLPDAKDGQAILVYDTHIDALDHSKPHVVQQGYDVLSMTFVKNVMRLYSPTLDELGVPKPALGNGEGAMLGIQDEFHAMLQSNASNPLLPNLIASEMLDKDKKYSPLHILPQMHYLLACEQVHGHSRDEVAAALPKCVALYDRFMALTMQHVAEIEHEEYRASDGVPKRLLPNPDAPAFLVPPIVPDATPTPPVSDVTPNVEEKTLEQLVGEITPVIERNLQRDPPYNQCSVMPPSGDPGREGYKIEVLMVNRIGETDSYYLATGTDNFEKVLELTEQLRPYVLGNPNMMPLYTQQSYHERVGHGSPPEWVLPHAPIASSTIPEDPTAQFYFTELSYDHVEVSGVTGDLKVRIPLGVRSRATEGALEEAIIREDWLRNHIDAEVKAGNWPTIENVTHALKRHVKETPERQGFGWATVERMMVPGYCDENGKSQAVDLGFPKNGKQKTILKSAAIEYDDGGARMGNRHPNPTWKLKMAFCLEGLGTKGDIEKTKTHDINLHTTDLNDAMNKAKHSLEGLQRNCADMAANNPSMQWRLEEIAASDGRVISDITIQEPYQSGAIPIDPKPQKALHLLSEDVPQYKGDFRIVEMEDKRRSAEDGRTYVTLGIQRGSDRFGSLEYFNIPEASMAGSVPQTLEFSVNSSEEASIPEVIATMNGNLQRFLKDIYHNRYTDQNGVERRNPRKKYRGATIRNALFQTFASELIHGEACSSIEPVHAAYRGESAKDIAKLERMAQKALEDQEEMVRQNRVKAARNEARSSDPMWTDALDEAGALKSDIPDQPAEDIDPDVGEGGAAELAADMTPTGSVMSESVSLDDVVDKAFPIARYA